MPGAEFDPRSYRAGGFGYKKIDLEWEWSSKSWCWCSWEQTMPVCSLQITAAGALQWFFLTHVYRKQERIVLNELKQYKGAQRLVGTGSVLCLQWCYWYLQLVARAAQAALLAKGHLPFCPSNLATQCYVWAVLLKIREKTITQPQLVPLSSSPT